MKKEKLNELMEKLRRPLAEVTNNDLEELLYFANDEIVEWQCLMDIVKKEQERRETVCHQ